MRGLALERATPPPLTSTGDPTARLEAFERARAEVDGLADDLAQAVTGDFDFRVRIETNDYVFQKLCIMVNFLLETVRRALGDLRERGEDLRRANGELEARNGELAEANRRLVETRARAIESAKMAAVGTLVAGLCHEINNPLGVILGFAESAGARIAADHPLALPMRSIEREAIRCRGIVRDLLAFSRSARAETSERVELGAVAASVAALVRGQAEIAKVGLEMDAPAGGPAVRGSRRQLEQVVLNLARNALDAMPGGGRLRIAVGRDAGDGVLTVEDTGTGVAADILDRIFEPFFTTKDVGKGTGLGLAVAREIVGRHGGRIDVASRPGAGSRFSVRLPAAGVASGVA